MALDDWVVEHLEIGGQNNHRLVGGYVHDEGLDSLPIDIALVGISLYIRVRRDNQMGTLLGIVEPQVLLLLLDNGVMHTGLLVENVYVEHFPTIL